jgi:hypothetical protein
MPGNIYHYMIRECRSQPKEEKNKDLYLDKVWNSRYDIKPKLSFIDRATMIFNALSNDFYFDILN